MHMRDGRAVAVAATSLHYHSHKPKYASIIRSNSRRCSVGGAEVCTFTPARGPLGLRRTLQLAGADGMRTLRIAAVVVRDTVPFD